MPAWTIQCGDCLEILPGLAADSIDVVCADPPYSAHVHAKQWQSKALAAGGNSRAASAHAELGFEALSDETRAAVAFHCARLAKRWVLLFCDLEGIEGWRADLIASGLDYVRTCIWDKVDSCPQFTGDRPASGAEAIVVAHRPGRKRWNGGGKRNVYRHPANSGPGGEDRRGPKPHPSTKPLPLMEELILDFTEPKELVLDMFMGSGSTLVAAVRNGRCGLGIERNSDHVAVARQRLEADEKLSTYRAMTAGQESLFR
jgi:DNA modification methylase